MTLLYSRQVLHPIFDRLGVFPINEGWMYLSGRKLEGIVKNNESKGIRRKRVTIRTYKSFWISQRMRRGKPYSPLFGYLTHTDSMGTSDFLVIINPMRHEYDPLIYLI